ncbi:hypothetical protein K503DRAFT_768246 [Rhizopogon vinicolor AM-OR11-026]|uniref:Uncharacterized protein n=1 Tax=Rhizopogon vinicolor AM-OR11-026 TaxID=1314800 RepID=A0A1B7N7J7_9AGAM|nr:hypothetical protein K503DRAFT_768246 [Rhizopogon vinicolor AM-OR11-026]
MLHTFNRIGDVQGSHPVDIKCEAIEDTLSAYSCTLSDTQYRPLLSLPISIRPHSSPVAHPRRAPFKISSLRQAHSKRDTRKLSEHRVTMSHQFTSRGTPSRMVYTSTDSHDRSSMDDGRRVMQSPSYGLPSAFVPPHGRMDMRPHSPGSSMTPTSSLSGAVGEMDIPHQLRNPATRPSYPTDPRAQTYWMPGAHNISTMQPHIHSAGPINNPYNITPTTDPNTPTHPNQLVVTPRSPSSTYTGQMPFQQARSPQNSPVPMMSRPGSQMSSDQFRRPSQDPEEENRLLRKKVKELELVNEQRRQRIRELEAELANRSIADRLFQRTEPSTSMITSIASGTASTPPAVQASWKARTDARIRLFCSLNRAGNALCSWHDSRRERRAHPPRMAPPGYLNCGCTYEEALFEESLSRHGVGSYHPGEAVRIDPALRNPLLKLLQERYGYRDGDFERNSATGNWVDGEGSAMWEQKLLSGSSSSRKKGEDRR